MASSCRRSRSGSEPLLEGPLGERQAGQQVPPIEATDLLERRRPAVGDQALELGDVDVHDRGVQGHGRAVEDEAGPNAGGEVLADARQGVAQVAAGLGIRHVSPEQGRELVAR